MYSMLPIVALFVGSARAVVIVTPRFGLLDRWGLRWPLPRGWKGSLPKSRRTYPYRGGPDGTLFYQGAHSLSFAVWSPENYKSTHPKQVELAGARLDVSTGFEGGTMYAAVRFSRVEGRILMVIVDGLNAKSYGTLRESLRRASGAPPAR